MKVQGPDGSYLTNEVYDEDKYWMGPTWMASNKPVMDGLHSYGYQMMYLYIALNSAYFSPDFAGVLNFNHAYLSGTWKMRTMLYYPECSGAFMEATQLGLEMAARMKRPLPIEDWHRLFELPIDEVRHELDITPVDPTAWAWTDEAWRG